MSKGLGALGERIALLWLLAHGYRLRHRNWRGGGAELDLIMSRGRTIIFVEVKSRSGVDFGGAAAAVDLRKQKKILRGAAAYLSRFELWERPLRFDVLTLEKRRGVIPFSVMHIPDAFQAEDTPHLAV